MGPFFYCKTYTKPLKKLDQEKKKNRDAVSVVSPCRIKISANDLGKSPGHAAAVGRLACHFFIEGRDRMVVFPGRKEGGIDEDQENYSDEDQVNDMVWFGQDIALLWAEAQWIVINKNRRFPLVSGQENRRQLITDPETSSG
jgi:hypothetical protein